MKTQATTTPMANADNEAISDVFAHESASCSRLSASEGEGADLEPGDQGVQRVLELVCDVSTSHAYTVYIK